MRYSTGLKVLAGVFAFGFLALIAGRDWRDARELLAGGLLGAILAVGLLRAAPRRDAFETEARRLGLRFSARNRFDLLDEPFALMRWSRRSYGKLDNVVWGTWHGLQVRAFEYEFSVMSQDDRRELSCAMVAIPGGWPALAIRPESFVTRVADVAVPDIAFESEEFNRAFEVRGEDRRFASAFADARMMAWLLSLEPRWGFEIEGQWLLGYRGRVQPWELEGVLETLATLLDKIPQAVSSLFPASVPLRPDVLR
jgi:hypothetical protein